MSGASLDDPRAKIDRAENQLNALSAEIRTLVASHEPGELSRA